MLKSVFSRYNNRFQTGLHYFSKVKTIKMKRINVRKIDGEERMQISWNFSVNPQNRGPGGIKQFNLDRLQSEELVKTLTRIQCNVSKLFNKKRKKTRKSKLASAQGQSVLEVEGTVPEDICVPVSLVNEQGEEITGEINNFEAWQNGSMLSIDEQNFEVVINPPSIISLSFPKCILSRFPCRPIVNAEFTNLEHSEFIWYRKVLSHVEASNDNGTSSAKRLKEDIQWEKIHEGHIYVPNDDDIGRSLKIQCQPKDGEKKGETVESISKVPVTKGPDDFPFERRQRDTQEYVKDEHVRVMSYNILADAYSDSDFSRNVLFPYCPEYALDINYRKHIFMKEIGGYKADIICLQEVDCKVFMIDLLPHFESKGYEGLHKVKMGQVPEGTATFFRKEKFRLLSQHDIGLNDVLQNDVTFKDLLEKINKNEQLKDKIAERTTTLQVSVLEHVKEPNHRLLVATTHLYFHPRAPHIRIIQTQLCLHHIKTVLKEFESKGEVKPSIIFTGDLNANPENGVHQLLTDGSIPAHHADWFAGGRDEFLEEMDLSHPFNLTSACGYPRYTNFVTGFSGCLDYIYIETPKLETVTVVPMPTHEEVTQYTALPNAVFPSDHLAVVCELKWT